MNVVCYERVCYEHGLFRIVCYEQVCFEREPSISVMESRDAVSISRPIFANLDLGSYRSRSVPD